MAKQYRIDLYVNATQVERAARQAGRHGTGPCGPGVAGPDTDRGTHPHQAGDRAGDPPRRGRDPDAAPRAARPGRRRGLGRVMVTGRTMDTPAAVNVVEARVDRLRNELGLFVVLARAV